MVEPNVEQLVELARLRSLLASGVARFIRESGDVSLRRAARACGVPHQTLGAWEAGEWLPRRKWEAALAYLALLDGLRASTGGRRAS